MQYQDNYPCAITMPAGLVTGAIVLPGLLLLAATPAVLGLSEALPEHGLFFGLGLLGAIFANSTGAGGGVVFVPLFDQLGFTETQAVATSFGTQCFGMTAGTATWSWLYFNYLRPKGHWQPFLPIILLCALFSVMGIWTSYGADLAPPAAVSTMFASFSLLLGGAILATVMVRQKPVPRSRLALIDWAALPLIAWCGGMVTAWLSVGVGEFVAFYLILRRYEVTLSVAVAVVISALSVWSAAPEHLVFNQDANWQVLAFAGPGAIAGGLMARHLVLRLGARRLKLFFGTWLLIIGLAEFIPMS